MTSALFSGVILSFMEFVVPVLILGAILKSPWFKGYLGEVIVRISAKLSLDKSRYTILNNVTLPTEDGTTQIDHIVVSQCGVFVIETKNIRGWIFGGEHQREWTQKIYKHTNKFQNPLHQNYKHMKTLAGLLDIDISKLFSVIVFVGDTTFKTQMPSNVAMGSGYVKYIKSKKEIILKKEEVDSITTAINSGKLKQNLKTYFDHVKHVKSIKEEKARTRLDSQ